MVTLLKQFYFPRSKLYCVQSTVQKGLNGTLVVDRSYFEGRLHFYFQRAAYPKDEGFECLIIPSLIYALAFK